MLELYRERLPATPAAVRLARHGVIDALTEAGLADAKLLGDIALTVTEATTNAIRHAYPPGSDGHLDIIVNRTPSSIIVTVTDEGGGITEALPETRGLGVGLAIMNSQAERLEIASGTAGTVVSLHFTTA